MINNFTVNFVKIKSSWFDKDGIINKIGVNGFYLYIQLYKYFLHNQNKEIFLTSVYLLKKDTGFTESETIDLIKLLIRHKIINTTVTRWDRYNQKNNLIIEGTDLPQTHREVRGNTEVDVPNTENDYYIVLDMKLLQEYKKENMNITSYSIYALINKYISTLEIKSTISINEIALRLNISNDKAQKTIRNLNRSKFMYSKYRKVNSKQFGKSYKFEHYLFNRFSNLEEKRKIYEKEIQKNINKWNKEEKIMLNQEEDTNV